MSDIHVLSLGAGVQSTAVYMLALEKRINLDYAVFADTGDEPKAVYQHLQWMQSLGGPPILRRCRGILSHDLTRRVNSTGQRFASVPFFTRRITDKNTVETGMTRRQCSKEYKVEVVERCIRRDILKLKPRARVPKDVTVYQYIGISIDEARRTLGVKKRIGDRARFPLIDLGWTRGDCIRFLEGRVPHEVPRSACVYCPFHSDEEWMRIRNSPDDWAKAVQVDSALRTPGNIVNRAMRGELFAHRSCVPLDQVQFKHEKQFNMFTGECEGMCGI